jgi:hypothetical protein
MGAKQSVREAQRKPGAIYDRIMQTADEIARTAIEIGWNIDDTTALCNRVQLVLRDTFEWLSAEFLKDTNVRLGIIAPQSMLPSPEHYEQARKAMCDSLVAYIMRKVRIAAYMRSMLHNMCGQYQEIIRQNIEPMLQGASPAVRADAYKRMRAFDDAVVEWYRNIAELLDKLKQSDLSVQDLTRLEQKINATLTSGYQDCCRAMYGMRDFAWTPLRDPSTGAVKIDTSTGRPATFVNELEPTKPQMPGPNLPTLARIRPGGALSPAEPPVGAPCGRRLNIQEELTKDTLASYIQRLKGPQPS